MPEVPQPTADERGRVSWSDQCEAPTCAKRTSDSKPFCIDHLELLPNVARIARKVIPPPPVAKSTIKTGTKTRRPPNSAELEEAVRLVAPESGWSPWGRLSIEVSLRLGVGAVKAGRLLKAAREQGLVEVERKRRRVRYRRAM